MSFFFFAEFCKKPGVRAFMKRANSGASGSAPWANTASITRATRLVQCMLPVAPVGRFFVLVPKKLETKTIKQR